MGPTAGGSWDEESYEKLFEKLDTNRDGKLDVAELRAGLIAMGISFRTGAAQVLNRPPFHPCASPSPAQLSRAWTFSLST